MCWNCDLTKTIKAYQNVCLYFFLNINIYLAQSSADQAVVNFVTDQGRKKTWTIKDIKGVVRLEITLDKLLREQNT